MSLDFFKDDGVFLPMLNDTGRNQFYKQALDIAAPGKVVCDIGAGTGMLTLIALQAGAKHVIAVERNVERFEYLKTNLAKLGFSDRVTMVCADFLDIDIAADIYVSETLNTQIFGEDIIKLSNHAQKHGGSFIPGKFELWVDVYENHPVFTLDLSHSEASEFMPEIELNSDFVTAINSDFADQYSLQDTVYKANQLNRLFPSIHMFTDLKLKKLYQSAPVVIDLNQTTDENNIALQIPDQYQSQDWAMLVLKWRATYQGITMDHDKCWFGNVAKPIRRNYASIGSIEIRYDPLIRNWRLRY